MPGLDASYFMKGTGIAVRSYPKSGSMSPQRKTARFQEIFILNGWVKDVREPITSINGGAIPTVIQATSFLPRAIWGRISISFPIRRLFWFIVEIPWNIIMQMYSGRYLRP